MEETTLPLLFSSLPDRSPPLEAPSEREKYWKTLASLKKLCVQQTLFETLVIRLTAKLDLICSPDATDVSKNLEASTAYAHAILKTLSDVLALKVAERHADVPKYAERLLPQLFSLFLHAALVSDEGRTLIASDTRLIRTVAPIISLVVQTLPQRFACLFPLLPRSNSQFDSGQSQFASKLFAAFLDGAVQAIVTDHQQIPDRVPYNPLQVSPSRVSIRH